MVDLTTTPESPIRPDWLGLENTPAFSLSQGRGSNPYRAHIRLGRMATELDEDGQYTQRALDIQTRELLRADLMPDESIRPRLAACDPEVVAALEEFRLNTLLAKTLGRAPAAPWTENELKWEAESINEARDLRAGSLLQLRVLGSGYGDFEPRNVNILSGWPSALSIIQKSPPLTWRDICARAEWLQDYIQKQETPPPDQPQSSPNGGADEKRQGDGEGRGEGEGHRGTDSEQSGNGDPRKQEASGDGRSHRNQLSSAQREALMQREIYGRIVGQPSSAELADDQRRAIARFLFEHNPDTLWGDMNIIECDLVLEHPTRFAARKIKPREYGDTFRFPERDVTDERVFGSMRQVRGGTILIDNSGSMSLSHEDMMELIRWAPNAEIAQYEGRSEDGDLKIIAHHGRVAAPADLVMHYGNNTIDGTRTRMARNSQAPIHVGERWTGAWCTQACWGPLHQRNLAEARCTTNPSQPHPSPSHHPRSRRDDSTRRVPVAHAPRKEHSYNGTTS
jgi:hypothetical protein